MSIPFLNKASLRSLTDEELVSRFSTTHEAAYFEELYRRYVHLSYGVCLKMLKNEEESRDVVAEVFRILYTKLPGTNIKSFKSYLYIVSRNESIARIRQQKNETSKIADWNNFENSDAEFVEKSDFFTHLDNEPSAEEQVELAVNQLGEEQRACIRLFFYEDKSYREIALQTGFSEKQVKSYLQNGKRNLRIFLEKTIGKRIA